MKTECTFFKVKQGTEERAEEWMRTISLRRDECIDTLEREAMYYESVFTSYFENCMYLAWHSVRGNARDDVNESTHEINKLHCAFVAVRCLNIK